MTHIASDYSQAISDIDQMLRAGETWTVSA